MIGGVRLTFLCSGWLRGSLYVRVGEGVVLIGVDERCVEAAGRVREDLHGHILC